MTQGDADEQQHHQHQPLIGEREPLLLDGGRRRPVDPGRERRHQSRVLAAALGAGGARRCRARSGRRAGWSGGAGRRGRGGAGSAEAVRHADRRRGARAGAGAAVRRQPARGGGAPARPGAALAPARPASRRRRLAGAARGCGGMVRLVRWTVAWRERAPAAAAAGAAATARCATARPGRRRGRPPAPRRGAGLGRGQAHLGLAVERRGGRASRSGRAGAPWTNWPTPAAASASTSSFHCSSWARRPRVPTSVWSARICCWVATIRRCEPGQDRPARWRRAATACSSPERRAPTAATQTTGLNPLAIIAVLPSCSRPRPGRRCAARRAASPSARADWRSISASLGPDRPWRPPRRSAPGRRSSRAGTMARAGRRRRRCGSFRKRLTIRSSRLWKVTTARRPPGRKHLLGGRQPALELVQFLVHMDADRLEGPGRRILLHARDGGRAPCARPRPAAPVRSIGRAATIARATRRDLGSSP